MPTKLIRSTYNITDLAKGAVITIGNFDGVHLGHQHLIARVIEKAKMLHVPSMVVTFEPHPFEFFKRGLTIPRITRLREKISAMADCGIDYVLILPFNQALAQKSPTDFVTQILHSILHPVCIIVGEDFRFGYQREGDVALLKSLGKNLNFSVEAMAAFMIEGERVSSTRVRKALAEGNHSLVKKLLSHPYSMMGRIRIGDQRGRQWGFPTANIYLHRKLTPVSGVYTVYMHGIANRPWPGVANVGVRPTVDGTRGLLEVHLLDFNQEIYRRYVKVEFCEKLREEMHYANVDLLKEQIKKDVNDARHYFQQHGVL